MPLAHTPPQILKSPPPAWEAEYKAWHQLQQLTLNKVKQYPKLDTKQQQQRGGDANTAKVRAYLLALLYRWLQCGTSVHVVHHLCLTLLAAAERNDC